MHYSFYFVLMLMFAISCFLSGSVFFFHHITASAAYSGSASHIYRVYKWLDLFFPRGLFEWFKQHFSKHTESQWWQWKLSSQWMCVVSSRPFPSGMKQNKYMVKSPKQQWETTCSDGITNKVINHHKILNDAKNGLI